MKTEREPINQRRLTQLYRMSQIVGGETSLSEILQVIVNVTAELMESKIVSVLMFDDRAKTLNIAATQSLSADYRGKPSVSSEHSVAGRALRTHMAQAVPDIAAENMFGFHQVAQLEGLRSMLCVPMLICGQPIGVVTSYSSMPRTYSEDDIKLLSLVASQAAVAIECARINTLTSVLRQMAGTGKAAA